MIAFLCSADTWTQVSKWYAGSILGKTSAFISHCYQTSRVKQIWNRYVIRKSHIYTSVYGKLIHKIGAMCDRFGLWFMPILKESILYSLYTACGKLFSWIWEHVVSESLIGKAISYWKLDIRRMILVFVGLYLPIDWLLRDIVKIAVLSSLWDEAFFALSIAYVFAMRIAGKKALTQNESHVSPLDIPILLFCAVGFCLMCVNSPVLSIAIDGYRATVQYMLWFFVVIRLIENDGDVIALAAALCLTGIAVSLHGCYQYIVGVPIPASWVSQTEAGVRTRAFSIMGSPNILGAFIVLTAPIVAAFSYTFHKLWKKALAWGAVCIMCLCLLVTFSRGAWIGMVVAVLIFTIIYDRRIFAPLAVAVPAVMFVPSIASRITYLFTDDFATASAVGGRALRWAVGREMMQTNPIIGFGLGRFGGAVAMQNQILEVNEEFSYFYMDNYYLKIGAEMGYTGLITFLILIAALIWFGMRCVARAKRSDSTVKSIPAGMFAGICGVAAHCYFENIFEVPYMMGIFWAMAAALMYFGYVRKNKTE